MAEISFSVKRLTTNGVAKLAGASASNRIIYTRMLTSEEYFDDEAASTASASDFSGPQGGIVAASAVEDIARVVGSVRNETSARIELKTFALCGQFEGDETDVVIMVLSDEAASVILPVTGGPSSWASMSFSLRISAGSAGMVEVTSAGSATVSDLLRFVSTHKAGNSAEGDDQAILGEKYFRDLCEYYAEVQFYKNANFGKDLIPQTDDPDDPPGNLGSVSRRWAKAFIDELSVSRIAGAVSLDSISPASYPGSYVGSLHNPYEYLYAGGLEMYGAEVGRPVAAGETMVDSIKFAYTSTIARHDVDIKANASHILLADADAVPALSLSSWARFTVQLKGTNCLSIRYSGDSQTFNAEFDIPVTVSAITGNQPGYNSGTATRSVKVGSILMGWFSSSAPVSKTGESLHNEPFSGTVQIKYAQSSNAGISGVNEYLPAGYYVLLCDLNSTGAGAWALVQCVSLD